MVYTIAVTNNGGAAGTYGLSDTPGFEDDVTINSGGYTGEAVGTLNTTGTTTLTTNNMIAAGTTETFTLTYNVTLDLDANSTDGGDNVYTACGTGGPNGNGLPGQGLYNLAELDTNNDGNPDDESDACGDLPNIILDKNFVSATVQPDGSYNVVYTIAVTNNGGAAGTYGLTDTPGFEDDVTINSGGYTGEAVGTLNTTGTTTLTTNNMIAAGTTETFTLTYNVTLDLNANSTDGGDNMYTACGAGGPNGNGLPGQGLYNLAELDTNNDGNPDDESDACGDLPNIILDKNFVSATVQPDGSYNVVYTIAVTNNGGAAGTYGLTDTPGFEDDVTINSGGYTGEAVGILNTTGATTLTTNNMIAAGTTETFTLTYNVTLDLNANSTDGGDNVYTACGTGGPNGNGLPGQGLYNLAELDTNNDGNPDDESDACGDLPNIILDKTFVSATVQPDGSYNVVYTIAVTNNGGAAGTYGLTDTPGFEDDVTINSGGYTGEAVGTLNTTGATTLTTNNMIAAGTTETFTLTYNVTLDLNANSTDGGDNMYTACGTGGPNGNGLPGQGLYNLAELDTNNDGNPDDEDDACGDLPNIILDKTFVSVTPLPNGTYNVVYTIAVTNNGGAAGTYGLTDTPGFEDDVTINSGGYTGEAVGTLNTTGATTLATNNMIAAGTTETFTLTYNVTLDLDANSTDGGDNVYTVCGTGGPNGNGLPGQGLYNLAELDTNNDGQPDRSDDDCGDLPLYDLALTKVLANAGPFMQNSQVVYTITVTNEGGIESLLTLQTLK